MVYDENIPHCKKCKYDLSGSPKVGYCPECGNPYSVFTQEGIVRPLTPTERGDLIMHWTVVGGLAGVAVCILICSGVLAFAAKDPKRAIIIGGTVALVPLGGAFAKWLSHRLDQRQK